MKCREFEARLFAILDGTLSEDDHARCAGHAASCPECFALIAPMGPALVPVEVPPPASLLANVLARTSAAPRRAGWAETWRVWVMRPRFASEAAFVGVAMICLASVAFDGPPVETQSARARVVIRDLCSEAGSLLDRATSLLPKEKP